jgi:hypothetical protein
MNSLTEMLKENSEQWTDREEEEAARWKDCNETRPWSARLFSPAISGVSEDLVGKDASE